MICYLIRHGQDDETIRGGWSQHPLTDEGAGQIKLLAEYLADMSGIEHIYTSDLRRALQTAQILADRLMCPVTTVPSFREVNNGDLAGMKNCVARERYPGLFWNQLSWEECYPNGESPKQFYERICRAWMEFSTKMVTKNTNVALVTHGGVIHVIRTILNSGQYRNTDKHCHVAHGEVIVLNYENGMWKEIQTVKEP